MDEGARDGLTFVQPRAPRKRGLSLPGRRVEMTAHRALYAGRPSPSSSRHYIAASLLPEPMMRRSRADLGENHDLGRRATADEELIMNDVSRGTKRRSRARPVPGSAPCSPPSRTLRAGGGLRPSLTAAAGRAKPTSLAPAPIWATLHTVTSWGMVLSDAEQAARYRERRKAREKPVVVRYRRLMDRRSKAKQ